MGGVDWIGLAKDWDKWSAHVKAEKLSNDYTSGGLWSSAQLRS
jgi:hypothetical protein